MHPLSSIVCLPQLELSWFSICVLWGKQTHSLFLKTNRQPKVYQTFSYLLKPSLNSPLEFHLKCYLYAKSPQVPRRQPGPCYPLCSPAGYPCDIGQRGTKASMSYQNRSVVYPSDAIYLQAQRYNVIWSTITINSLQFNNEVKKEKYSVEETRR